MKAFKPDGSRWFAPTASEVMGAWLESPQLQDWLERTIEFRAGDAVGEVLARAGVFDAVEPSLAVRDPATRAAALRKLGQLRAKLQVLKQAAQRAPVSLLRVSKHARGHQPKQSYRGRR